MIAHPPHLSCSCVLCQVQGIQFCAAASCNFSQHLPDLHWFLVKQFSCSCLLSPSYVPTHILYHHCIIIYFTCTFSLSFSIPPFHPFLSPLPSTPLPHLLSTHLFSPSLNSSLSPLSTHLFLTVPQLLSLSTPPVTPTPPLTFPQLLSTPLFSPSLNSSPPSTPLPFPLPFSPILHQFL